MCDFELYEVSTLLLLFFSTYVTNCVCVCVYECVIHTYTHTFYIHIYHHMCTHTFLPLICLYTIQHTSNITPRHLANSASIVCVCICTENRGTLRALIILASWLCSTDVCTCAHKLHVCFDRSRTCANVPACVSAFLRLLY